ncbi:DNA repair protein XRCC1 isoform X2 [Amblyomma americanum]
MPVLKIQHVVSFSSEDKVHKAENLLKPETYRKWKCASPGEKQASVILQLEKASVISAIDIGNESSAFIEVLVARSSDPTLEFNVLLGASSFMTPMDARQGANLNRVRMFGSEKLSQSFIKEKWDRVKVVCTQPFNKSIQYGLAFIKLHSPEDSSSKAGPSPKAALGSFQLKDEEDEADLAVGAWFAKRKEKASVDPSTSPAAIKAASYGAATLRSMEEKTLKPSKPQSREKDATEEAKDSSSASPAPKAPKPPTVPAAQRPTPSETKKKPVVVEKATPKEAQRPQTPKAQKKKEKPAKKFEELMKGVVFVLSGFQNPLRSQIRDKALEMGARYKADWDRSCTHLVCAFLNTPKYIQVKAAGGKIVKKEWIFDSYKERHLLPWLKYKLGSYHRPSTPECDDEDDDEADGGNNESQSPRGRPAPKRPPARDTAAGDGASDRKARRVEEGDRSELAEASRQSDEEGEAGESDFDAPTDVDEKDEDIDTEEEIEKVKQQQAAAKAAASGGGGARAGAPSPERVPLDLPELPDFFTGKSFLLYGDFPEDERRALTRYIVGHDGDLREKLDDSVKFVITKSDWSDYFDEALSANESLVFIRPRWVSRCHESGRRVPYQPFVVACPEL